ncbi:hypothetical protein ACNSPG_06470 [Brucella pituitosa]|uniref:hypothetical protein n=1 Tax=Brucella pituitosa TaxID=571256 RepID=UPI003C77779D
MNQEIITQDGEVFEETTALASTSMAVQLQKAEIDQLVSTAHAFPRSLKRVQSNILGMATLDEESAEECIYALPRGGKPIRGPSIRFAEILKQSYGNCRAAARVVHVDKTEGYIEAEGVFHDLETNAASTARVRRRITDRAGRVFKDDMIIVTGNAACSIAMRNAILAGVPKPLWRKAYDMVQATITGDITTLSENREKAFKALAAFGVKPDQIFASLGVQGEEDITVDHIATLRGMYSALKNGEATVEEMFIGTVKAISDHAKIENPFSAEPATAQTNNVPPEPETLASEPDTVEQDQPSNDGKYEDANAWVVTAVNMLIASVFIGGDIEIMRNQYRAVKQNAPEWVDLPTMGRVNTVSMFLAKVMDGEEEFDKQRIANMAKLEADQINDLPEV